MDDLSAETSVPRLVELPIDVQSAVRSGKTINCAAQAVEELVLNAIDAEATEILVGIDLSTFRIRIDDNGNGIQRQDLEQIGTRFATTKGHYFLEDLNNIRSYGFRGEALASIIDISVDVELFSRAKLDEYCYTKKFRNGKQNGTIIESHGSERKTSGLSISITNFMGKFQVRQNRIDHSIELEEIKAVLERILLVNPHVALVFTNDTTGTKILNISSSLSVALAFRKIFIESKNGMASHEHLLESYFDHFPFFLKIYVSKASHHSKNLQLVFVNKRYLARGKIHGRLNQALFNLFGFDGRKTGNETRKENTKRSCSSGFKIESRSLKKYPVFILNIQCPPYSYDIKFDLKKTILEFSNWDSVLEGLEGLKDRVKVSFENDDSNIVVTKHFGQSKLVPKPSSEAVAFTSKEGRRDSGNLENGGKHMTTTTRSMRRAVHSRVAVRGGGEEDPAVGQNSDGAQQRTYGQSISMSRGSQHPSDDEGGEMSKDDDDSSKLKTLKNQRSSKLQLSIVSRKKTGVEIKRLRRKRKNTFDDSAIYTKRHQALAEKSSHPFDVGLPKNLSEKFSPWRLKFEGRETESLDRIKLVPWRINSQQRKADEVSDQSNCLNTSNSDTDKGRPRISRPRRVKNNKHSPVPRKRRKTTLEESDSASGNILEDVPMSQNAKQKHNCENGIEDKTGFSQNKMNIPMSQSQEVEKISNSSSDSGVGCSGLVGNRHCLHVISGHLESMAAFLGMEDCDSYALSLPLRLRTAFYIGMLPERNENEVHVTKTETGPSADMFAASSVIPSVESPAATTQNQPSIKDNEVTEINANVTVVAETPPNTIESEDRWSPWIELGVGGGNSVMTNVHPSEATGPVMNFDSLEELHLARGLGANSAQCSPPVPPKKKIKEKLETQDNCKVDEERKQFKELVNTAIFLDLIDGQGNSDKRSDIEKWVNLTVEQKRRKFSTLVGEHCGLPNRVFDHIQHPSGHGSMTMKSH